MSRQRHLTNTHAGGNSNSQVPVYTLLARPASPPSAFPKRQAEATLAEAAKTPCGERTPISARMSRRSLRNVRWVASHALRGAKRPPGASPCSRMSWMSWPAISTRNIWKRWRSQLSTRQTLRRRLGAPNRAAPAKRPRSKDMLNRNNPGAPSGLVLEMSCMPNRIRGQSPGSSRPEHVPRRRSPQRSAHRHRRKGR